MNINWVIGIVLALGLVVFVVYSTIAIQHAAQFRYISKRTVYLTILYVSLSTVLLLLTLATGLIIILN